MSNEREKLWGKGGICHCGNCEAVAMRAVEIVGKMMMDNECTQYAVALGVAISAAASISLGQSIEVELASKGGPLMGALFADDTAASVCNDIASTFKTWMDGPGYDIVVEAMNKHIDKVNKKLEAEQNLPKGD